MFANLILDLRPLKDRAAANCVSGTVVNKVKEYLYHYFNGLKLYWENKNAAS